MAAIVSLNLGLGKFLSKLLERRRKTEIEIRKSPLAKGKTIQKNNESYHPART